MSESTKQSQGSLARIGLALAIAASVSACATGTNPRDPLEGYNRAMFKFNDTVDQVALKPVATAYKTVTPSFVQTGVGNFFGNLSDVWSAVNNLLQGKGEAGLQDVVRVSMNSTFGIFGLIDIASQAGIPKHNEDFGQTLGWYGVQPGPYVMLPLLGPSTVRDTVALPLDITGDPWRYKDPVSVRNIGTVTRVVDKRAALLDATNLMEAAALDRYEFIRDGFLQARESKVFDGDTDRRDRKVPKNDTSDYEPAYEAQPQPVPAETPPATAAADVAPADLVTSGSNTVASQARPQE
ncbi:MULTISPECIES: VacJ family lipoprotein [unclassified Janthinobacterium]|uniref:MlaA family lipoprotein n=1 Tax=unclassified Janthinobacterium TaxID=2610881 RepID=UPI0009839D1F|nr:MULTISPECIES: VacJ family lipoprotein [unclassified Janthinobacterium]AQR67026.1 ABC transporter [Janthinobacterium sp. LM6]MDN2674744.1 VacJ family lipoprotein [Janthinobacterium sp. SUN026]MDN2706018.1 VacJ family lipoprotein [Janthinobacterium sp. SUN100]MDN2718677.1 VacJ family lipoprotein [Janthinobacterium sp. SUN120]MDO8042920.1 VacJ family lipoprotein [Janthinobacterium sp. SUN137]